jgi:hypothetical protein
VNVTLDTKVTRYEGVVSLVFISIRIQSRFLFENDRSRKATLFANSLFTLVFGWWGIPWGPIWTSKTLYQNARGGMSTRVGDLLTGMGSPEIIETNR